MAQKFSTALVNMLTGGRNLRSVLDNCVLRILSGAAPSDADQAETGTLLCIVSNGSVGAGATALPITDDWYLTLPSGIPAGPTAGKTIKAAISLDGVNGTYTYTVTGGDGGTGGAQALLSRVANMINQAQRPVRAIGVSGASDLLVAVSPVVRGLGMTLLDGGGDDLITPVHRQTATRPGSLQFGPPVAGVISKLAGDTWTGVNLANGVAGYFRLVLPDDTTILDSVFNQIRIQGSIGTSGADLNLDSVQFITSATTTISAFSIQEPMSS